MSSMSSGAAVIKYEGKQGVVWRIKWRDAAGQQVQETLGTAADGWTKRRAESGLRADGARLRVRETLVRGQIDTPKSERGERTLAFGRRLADELFQHRARTAYAGDGEYVFVSPTKGSPFDAVRYRGCGHTARGASGACRTSLVRNDAAVRRPRRRILSRRGGAPRAPSVGRTGTRNGYKVDCALTAKTTCALAPSPKKAARAGTSCRRSGAGVEPTQPGATRPQRF
jgi:hypothetical protein